MPEPHAFSLTHGGPFDRLLPRLHLRTADGKLHAWLFGFLLWLPLALGASTRALLGMTRDSLVFDIAVHVRLLVALPVLLASEQLLDVLARSSLASFYDGAFCDRARIDRIVERAERLRDSSRIELALLALAVTGGQLVLWEVAGTAGWIAGGEHAGFWSFPRVWYALVALPVFQFVLFRWLVRWLIWAYILARIARLPLAVLATHPDYAGGLGCLSRPIAGFTAFALANGTVLAGAWGTQLLFGRTTLTALTPLLVVFVLVTIALAIVPLLPLSLHLFRARRRTVAEYGDFGRRYVVAFHERWIERNGDGQDALGSPDIQSLADLGNSFQVAAKTRMVAFETRDLIMVVVASILPLIPVFASVLSIDELLRRLATTLIGGFPRGGG